MDRYLVENSNDLDDSFYVYAESPQGAMEKALMERGYYVYLMPIPKQEELYDNPKPSVRK